MVVKIYGDLEHSFSSGDSFRCRGPLVQGKNISLYFLVFDRITFQTLFGTCQHPRECGTGTEPLVISGVYLNGVISDFKGCTHWVMKYSSTFF